MPSPPPVNRRVVPGTKWRDTLIALAAGAVVLGFVLYAVFSLGRQANSTGGVDGIIVGKDFVPRPETQITVGQGGVRRRRSAGDYILRVRVPSEHDRVYRVAVDPAVYDGHREGDHFYFLRPTS